jgi:hypothetical protein|tara:strand:+ start:6352 stop:6681 length:330 start_codon:yes stop_codon:yes gene_type:complete
MWLKNQKVYKGVLYIYNNRYYGGNNKMETKEKIRELVREKIKSNEFDGSSYWDWYRWVKSLGFGHRPTKQETNEVLFFGLSLNQNPTDWKDGRNQLAEKCKKLQGVISE